MATTNFPNGVTNAKEGGAFGSFGALDRTKYHEWFDDFDNFEADQWIITEEIASSAGTSATVDGDGGILQITTDVLDDQHHFLQWSGDDALTTRECWKFERGKKLWFAARWKVSAAVQSDLVMGLQITDMTPLSVTDGVYFMSVDESAALNLVVVKNSAATTREVATLTDDTYIETAFYYNGADDIAVFINDVCVAHVPVANLPDDEELTISFGLQNGSAGSKAMAVDYIGIAKERRGETG